MSSIGQNGIPISPLDLSGSENTKTISNQTGISNGHKFDTQIHDQSKKSLLVRTISSVFTNNTQFGRQDGIQTPRKLLGNQTPRENRGNITDRAVSDYTPISQGGLKPAIKNAMNKLLNPNAKLSEEDKKQLTTLTSDVTSLENDLKNNESESTQIKRTKKHTKNELSNQLKEITKRDYKQGIQQFVKQDREAVEEVLSDPVLFDILYQYATKEFSTENVEFYDDLQTLSSSDNWVETQHLATYLFEQVKESDSEASKESQSARPQYSQLPDEINLPNETRTKAAKLFTELKTTRTAFKDRTDQDKEVLKDIVGMTVNNIKDTYHRALDVENPDAAFKTPKDIAETAQDRMTRKNKRNLESLKNVDDALNVEKGKIDNEIQAKKLEIKDIKSRR